MDFIQLRGIVMVAGYVLITAVLGALIWAGPAVCQDRPVVGWVERVRIYPGAILLPAKLDTGADHCSLNALNLSQISRGGEKMGTVRLGDPVG